MSDFCRQCSEKIFGEDFGDHSGLVTEGQTATVICEGCGYTVVDHEGVCVSEHCVYKHGVKEDG